MYQKTLTEKEIQFCEMWYDPTALTECLIPENIKAPHTWNQDSKCLKLRNYQFAMQNYSYMYGNNPKLSAQQNFNFKKVAGTIFNIAARNLGKSLWIFIDTFLTTIHSHCKETLLASCDDTHLKKVTSTVLNLFREHPFFEVFRKTGKVEGIKAQPVEVYTQHGNVLYGRNEKIDDPEPGTQFHSIHAETTWYEEASYMTNLGTEKRVDAISSLGCIERLSGIPDVRVGSPLGELLRHKKNKKFICRIPQYVRDDWSKETAEEQAAKYKGRNSTAYKLNVEAEIVEGAESKWDMERIRKNCLNTDIKIKFFEVSKELFVNTDDLNEFDRQQLISERLYKRIIISRLPCKKIIVASDIGTSASPSEVAIYFCDDKDKWKYHYQISLFKLTVREQAYIFNWIYNVLGSCFIALDSTNADGDAIRDKLIKEFKLPEEYLPFYKMQKNIEVEPLKNDKGQIIKNSSGKPLMKEVYTKSWAVQQLENIFYNSLIEIPYDEKFLDQFANHWEKLSANGKPFWGSTTEEHLVDTFLVFALCAWETEFKNTKNLKNTNRCLGTF